jgi:hypothetical protein
MSTVPDSRGTKVATELRDPSRPALRIGNHMVLKGWRQVDGYAGLEPARRLDYRDVNALREAGVERVLRSSTSEAIPGLVPLDDRWLAVPDPLPRARCVGQVEHTGLRGSADILSDRPGHIRVATATATKQWLLISERFHRGWTATVDGKHVDVLRANGEFLACEVPAERHTVEFTFDPPSLRYGKWLTAIGLLLLGFYGVRSRGQAARSRSQALPGNALLARLCLASSSLRAALRGRASGALRSQAEPGNEKLGEERS